MRLIGDDMLLIGLRRAGIYNGNGQATLTHLTGLTGSKLYQILQKSPANSVFGDISVGTIYYSRKNNETLSVGDKVQLFSEEVLADTRAFTLNISAANIKVTTIDDIVTKYVKGIQDATGSVTFQVDTERIKSGEIYNEFFKILTVSNIGVNTNAPIQNKEFYIKGLLQRENISTKEQMFLFAQVELFDIDMGKDMGTAQEFTSSIKLKGLDPVLVVVEAE